MVVFIVEGTPVWIPSVCVCGGGYGGGGLPSVARINGSHVKRVESRPCTSTRGNLQRKRCTASVCISVCVAPEPDSVCKHEGVPYGRPMPPF